MSNFKRYEVYIDGISSLIVNVDITMSIKEVLFEIDKSVAGEGDKYVLLTNFGLLKYIDEKIKKEYCE